MSGGCNSCKNLDPKSKNPGRTSGYVFLCKVTGKWVNGAKDSCDYYEEDLGRSSYEINTIYKESNEYNDMINSAGCNSCANLDEKSKKPGKTGGALYYCKAKGTYIKGSDNSCEQYRDGFRDRYDKNKIFEDGKNYSDSNSSMGSLLFILVLLIIFAIVYTIFFK